MSKNGNYQEELEAMLLKQGVSMDDMASDSVTQKPAETVKPKRGRKPKSENDEPAVTEKPKRGRKAKAVNAVPEAAVSEPKVEQPIPVIPTNLFSAMERSSKKPEPEPAPVEKTSESEPVPISDGNEGVYAKIRDIQDSMSSIKTSFQKYAAAQLSAFDILQTELTALEAELHGKQ